MNELKKKFNQQYPDVLYLSLEEPESLEHYLRQQFWIGQSETINLLEKPGEGNMNMVARVVTNLQRLIVKQARPWVEKYPQMAAPPERTSVEATFYELISDRAVLNERTPDLIGFDHSHFMIILQDMGDGSDYTHLYQAGQSLNEDEVGVLVNFISELHRIRSDQSSVSFPTNQAMRELNHEHIFQFPLQENSGFNLDDIQDGLQELSIKYKHHNRLKKQADKLGKRYLSAGTTMLHGDYYPGSWLKTAQGVRVIDPEFAFMGDAEFDIGVMIAHLTMAQSQPEIIQQVLQEYQRPDGYNESLQQAFTGMEILRRLIGLAQLPLSLTLSEKEELLAQAADMVLQY